MHADGFSNFKGYFYVIEIPTKATISPNKRVIHNIIYGLLKFAGLHTELGDLSI